MPHKRCEHGKAQHFCKDCGGAGICIHHKKRHECVACLGYATCVHAKLKVFCKTCGGSRLCKSSWCETQANNKYDGYCVPCFVNNPLNADKLPARNHKTKETDVVDYIRQTYPDFDWVADKRVKDGCSGRRPDLLLDLGSHIVIVEIDENKHSNYVSTCEIKRLNQLSIDLHHRPIVFIRFNPDAYTDVDKNRIPSCWKLSKGILIIGNKTQWIMRLETLKQQITYWIENPPTDEIVEIVHLFY